MRGDWNAKVGSQETPGVTGKSGWPWSTKRSRSKANRVLPREHTGHSKHPLPTTQEKREHPTLPNYRSRGKNSDYEAVKISKSNAYVIVGIICIYFYIQIYSHICNAI